MDTDTGDSNSKQITTTCTTTTCTTLQSNSRQSNHSNHCGQSNHSTHSDYFDPSVHSDKDSFFYQLCTDFLPRNPIDDERLLQRVLLIFGNVKNVPQCGLCHYQKAAGALPSLFEAMWANCVIRVSMLGVDIIYNGKKVTAKDFCNGELVIT